MGRRVRLKLLIVTVTLVFVMSVAAGAAYVKVQLKENPHRILNPIFFAGEDKKVRVLGIGIDGTDQLTDVILYAVFDTVEYNVQILQIPRDVYVGDDYLTGKLNIVYKAGGSREAGLESMKKVLREMFGLETDYCVTINLEGFRGIVDAMGGIPIYINQRIEYLPGQVLEEGIQVLDGEKAEWFVRYRSGYATADLGRLDAHRQFMEAAFRQAKTLSPGELLDAVSICYKHVYTDLPLSTLLGLAGEAAYVETDDLAFFTVPGEGVMRNGYSVYSVDKEKTVKILNEHFLQEAKAPDEFHIPAAWPDSERLPASEEAEGRIPEQEEDFPDASFAQPEDLPWLNRDRMR